MRSSWGSFVLSGIRMLSFTSADLVDSVGLKVGSEATHEKVDHNILLAEPGYLKISFILSHFTTG